MKPPRAKSKTASGQKPATRAKPKRKASLPLDLLPLGEGVFAAEDMNAFWASLEATLDGPDDPALDEAQDLMFEAFEAEDAAARRDLSNKALALSPNCADAYTTLAELEAPGSQAQIDLYRQAVAAGERGLGDSFAKLAGEFWGFIQTRPYMRARAGLAMALEAKGDGAGAATEMAALLDLNPNDNQGIRYLLSVLLFRLGRDAELEALLKRYKDDGSAAWTFLTALHLFRRKGAKATPTRALGKALAANPHVAAYLLGTRKLPAAIPDYVGIGDRNEAVVYASEMGADWAAVPGALDWLRSQAGPAAAKPQPRRASKPA